MPDGLYDRDIVAWSDQQAESLRRLMAGERPNDLDLLHIIEEIEALGRSELRAVESSLIALMSHLLYLHVWPQHSAGRGWRSEVLVFAAQARRSYLPSMRQKLDLDDLWRDTRRELLKKVPLMDGPMEVQPPADLPWTLDDLIDPEATAESLLSKVQP
jgi:hypothetical protein